MLDEMNRLGLPLVSAEAVAKQLGCSKVHVHVMARDKRITSHRLGKKCVRFNLDQVLEELGVTKGAGQ